MVASANGGSRDSVTKLGESVRIKSRREDEMSVTRVGISMICEKPFLSIRR